MAELRIKWEDQGFLDEHLFAKEHYAPHNFVDFHRGNDVNELEATARYIRKLMAIKRTEGIKPAVLHELKATCFSSVYRLSNLLESNKGKSEDKTRKRWASIMNGTFYR